MAPQNLPQNSSVHNIPTEPDELARRAAATGLELARILILNEINYLAWQERTRRAGEGLAANV
jgi:hypothetical protein